MSAELLELANALAFNVGFASLLVSAVLFLLSRMETENRGATAFLVLLALTAAGGWAVSCAVSGLSFLEAVAAAGGSG